MQKTRTFPLAVAAVAFFAVGGGTAIAAGEHAQSGGADGGSHTHAGATVSASEPIQLAYSAAGVLRGQMQETPDSQIPESLLAGAHCIGVFPQVFKEGLIVAGKHGDGIVACRGTSGDWNKHAPAFYSLSGGSIGLQAGAQVTTLVMLFMDNDAVQQLQSGNIKVGANASGAAGPTGAHAGIHTAPAGVVVYRLGTGGGFAGAQIQGVQIAPDKGVNRSVYGDSASVGQLLTQAGDVPKEVQVFSKALADYAPSSNFNPQMKVAADGS